MNALVLPRPARMPQLWRETRAELLKLFRTPSFIIPTIALPALFYSLFALGMQGSSGGRGPTYMLSTYIVFGSMAPGLFGIGATLAAERASGWFDMQRASPLPLWVFLCSKALVAVTLALFSMFLVMGIAGFAGGVRLHALSWILLAGVTFLSAVPFALLGMAIGLYARQGGAAALANLLFLPVAFFSGLWFPLQALLPGLQHVGWVLPAYHLAQVALILTGQVVPTLLWVHLGISLLWIAAFAALAWFALRRSERRA